MCLYPPTHPSHTHTPRPCTQVDAELSGISLPASSLEEGSLRVPGLPSTLTTPPGSAMSSMRAKSQLPPLVGSGRSSRGSNPSSPSAPLRTHTPLATRPSPPLATRPSPLGLAGQSPKTSAPSSPPVPQSRTTSHSPIPTILNEDDEQMINDLMEQ